MKLKSQKYAKKEYANQSVTFPVIGEAKFDADGNLDIVDKTDEQVEMFILLTKKSFNFASIAFVEQQIKHKEKKTKKQEKEQKELESMLDAATYEELLALLKETEDKQFIEQAIQEVWNETRLREKLKQKLSFKN